MLLKDRNIAWFCLFRKFEFVHKAVFTKLLPNLWQIEILQKPISQKVV